MADRPVRIQRKRVKGWRMPPNTVYVGRSSRWGNPFLDLPLLIEFEDQVLRLSGRYLYAADAFRLWLEGRFVSPAFAHLVQQRQFILTNIHELRGRDLACWCKEYHSCHADVLLELANR